MKKTLLIFTLVLTAVMILSSFVTLVIADQGSNSVRRQTNTSGHVWYTQTNVVLGGANGTIKVPDNWNGGLVVLCRGYVPSVDSIAPASIKFNPNAIPLDAWTWFIDSGYATAATNYGSGGYTVKEGIISAHQLTEYVINNYQITGKVYVSGISMGANIALHLGVKYPDLYAGVMELCGPKDLFTQITDKTYYSSLTSDLDLSAAVTLRGGVVPPYPTPNIASFRLFCQYSCSDTIIVCGGNPAEKPQFYERLSPLYSCTDISIPTITLHGTADALVPFSQSVDFKNAVAANGDLGLYRLYKVTGGQHGDILLTNQIAPTFNLLSNWVEHGIVPPTSTA